MSVKGVERVKTNMSKAINTATTKKTEIAIYSVLSQGASIAQTMTPMKTGHLAQSQYEPSITSSSNGMAGIVGYTALYAGAVHEMPGKLKGLPRQDGSGKYWDPDAEPQFLNKGFEELKPQIPKILKEIYSV